MEGEYPVIPMPRKLIGWLPLAAIALSLWSLFLTERAAADVSPPSPAAVADLIEQLGSDSYATRIRAKEQLQRIGLEAFDQLHLAQFHPDSEIAITARFLVSSLLVSWSKESDPPEVRDTLLEYGALGESERSSRIDRLAEFPNRVGLPALVRVANYERSLRLGRRAAIALMQQPLETDTAARQRSSEQILANLADNDRQTTDWLRAYAEDLASGGYSSERWRRLIADQRQAVDTAATQQASRASVLELVQVCASRAALAGLKDEAIALATEHLDLIPPTSRGLIDASSWAIDHGLHPFVLELRRQHSRMFDKQAILLYGAAEAEKVSGDEAQADRLAMQASQINPLPNSGPEGAAPQGAAPQGGAQQPKEVEEAAKAHREIANLLVERGLFHWAEREFRLIIDSLDLESLPSVWARSDLAQLLGELERHRDVVDLLRPLIDRLERDAKLKQQLLAMTMFSYSQIRSSADYHQAMDLIQTGKLDEARSLLVSAFQLYPANVDILITMYRLDGDETWRNLVEKTLQSTVREVDSSIETLRDHSKRLGEQLSIDLGYQLNQYAWLVSNTEGDQRKALDYSLESLEIETDAARLDTCARCYFAVGDLENAIRVQKRALKLMPHSPPLSRQLAMLEGELAKQSP
jgi:tetratricopeptide (TPR) repeat protein